MDAISAAVWTNLLRLEIHQRVKKVSSQKELTSNVIVLLSVLLENALLRQEVDRENILLRIWIDLCE